MRKEPAHLVTIKMLENEGWSFDHTATVNRYKYAGTVSQMKSHNGFEYCRVHHGVCAGTRSYQITTVMKRAIHE